MPDVSGYLIGIDLIVGEGDGRGRGAGAGRTTVFADARCWVTALVVTGRGTDAAAV
jgi:hypothetical protein